MEVKDLMAKVGKIRILTNRLIDDQLSGDYHSTFKGQGVEFDEVRPYVPGDDVRTIDWNVTARTGQPFIKRFSEERELTVMFLVDISGSQTYGSVSRSKAELAAEVTALLALTAIKNQDKIGLVLFSDKVVNYIPPRKGRQSVMRIVREVLAAEDEAVGGTDIAGAIRFLNGVQKRKCAVFLVSDFQDSGYEKLLRVVARRHDVVCVSVADPAERQLPDVGLAELEDPETGELVLVDTSDKSVREAFAENAVQDRQNLLKFFNRSGIDHVELSTNQPYINEIRALFKRRARKR
ncbi:MAG: DUF58 domain-containing protein [Kiritimatiellae bacterium]|nr:DUF58 domain-containing protein [Kiritimatiellia bacterium]